MGTVRVVVAMLALCACGGRRGADERACRDLMQDNAFERAVEPCERAFRRGDAASGASAARARLHLGQGDRVLALAEELARTSRAGDGAYFAGRVHDSRGETERARAAYERARELHQVGGDRLGMGRDAYMLYRLHWLETRYGEALRWAEAARVDAAAAGDEQLRLVALQALANAYWEIGQVGLAETATRDAMALLPEGDPRRAPLYVHEGLTHLAEGRREMARRAFERAEKLAEGGDPSTARAARLDLVEMALDDGDLATAGRLLDLVSAALDRKGARHGRVAYLYYRARWHLARAEPADAWKRLDEAEAAGPASDWRWELELARGAVLEAQGDRDGAEAAYERSIAALEQMRGELGSVELKAWFFPKRRRPFEALFAVQAATGRVRHALATAERAQARAFLDAFTAARSEMPQSLERGVDEATARIAALERIAPALSRWPAASPAPIDQVLSGLRDLHAWVYVRVRDELDLVVVSRGEPRLIRLATPAARVIELTDAIRARPDDERLLRELGDALIPAEALPPAGTTIHIVVDRALEPVPFAALAPRGRRLVDDHALAHAPSLTVLAALARDAGATPAAPRAVVIADARGDLPAADREARWVAAKLGAEAHVGAHATEERVREAAEADLLHLSTHTGLDAAGAWIELAGGRVSASRVLGWGVRPRLVVLASCASATSASRGAWGSLGAAFLAAGSRHVVAALRSVGDAAAERLVRAFYEQDGLRDPVGALARAQRLLARQWPPSTWGAFVVVGAP